MQPIDADAILELYKIEAECVGKDWTVDDLVAAIECASTLNDKHGYWKDNGNETISCSHCATWFPKEREPYLLFCGYCGAKMDKEE